MRDELQAVVQRRAKVVAGNVCRAQCHRPDGFSSCSASTRALAVSPIGAKEAVARRQLTRSPDPLGPTETTES